MGLKYATDLAERAQYVSLRMLIAGWTCVAFAALLAILSAVFGTRPIEASNLSVFTILRAQRGIVCGSCAIILAGLGWQFIKRADSASYLACAATYAIGESVKQHNKNSQGDERSPDAADRLAYELCVEAKVTWLIGRMDHEELGNIVREMKGTGEERTIKSSPTSQPDLTTIRSHSR